MPGYEFEAALPFIASTLTAQGCEDEEGGAVVRHELVCRHWLRGKRGYLSRYALGICLKEWKCDFLHILDDTRMPFCRSQKRHGRCNDQILGLCQLKHNAEEEEGEQSNSAVMGGGAGASNTGSSDTEICFRYLYGYCPHGPMCHLRHVRADRHPQIPLPNWYLSLILNGDISNIPQLSDDERRKAAIAWAQVALRSEIPADSILHSLTALKPLPSLLPPSGSNGPIRCFILKSGKIENILTSVQKGIWATGRANMQKLSEAYRECQHVVILMSGNESGGFQGYCRMSSNFDPTLYPGVWGTFSNKLSPNFRIQWLKQTKLDFQAISTYTNPLNFNLPLKKSRDGQELTYELTEIICNLLHQAPYHDLLSGTPLQLLPRIDHATFFQLSPQQQIQQEITLGLRPRPPVVHAPIQHQQPPQAVAAVPPPQIVPTPAQSRNQRPRASTPSQHRKRTRDSRYSAAPDVNPYLQMAERRR